MIGSLIKQESYKEDLFKSLEEVKKRVQIIKEEAQQAQGQMLLGIDGKTNQVHSFLQSLLELLRTNPRYSSAGPGNLSSTLSRIFKSNLFYMDLVLTIYRRTIHAHERLPLSTPNLWLRQGQC